MTEKSVLLCNRMAVTLRDYNSVMLCNLTNLLGCESCTVSICTAGFAVPCCCHHTCRYTYLTTLNATQTPSPEALRLAQLQWDTWHQTQSCMQTQLMLFLASLHHTCVCMLTFDRRLGLCSVYARAFREGFTVTLVSGRTVGIGAYLARLGRRSVKMHLTINVNSSKGSCQY